MLRITGGELRGRTFTQPLGIRPTSAKVREAVFNILQSKISLEGVQVLELFAGSGALGFEALSRAAAHVTFVEQDRKVSTILQQNIQKLDLSKTTKVLPLPAESALHSTFHIPHSPFQLILADPPYELDFGWAEPLSNFLTLDGLLVLEYASRTKQPELPGLDEISTHTYGDTTVTIYRRAEARALP